MLPVIASIALQAALASAPLPGSGTFNPHANELFDRDAQLRSWALRQYDRNGDGWLTLYEAQPAIAAFREIADSDSDGRITVVEFRRAKEFIAARW